jgi:hypothetical protein
LLFRGPARLRGIGGGGNLLFFLQALRARNRQSYDGVSTERKASFLAVGFV